MLRTDYEESLKIFYKQVVEKGKQGLESDSVAKLIKKIIESSLNFQVEPINSKDNNKLF